MKMEGIRPALYSIGLLVFILITGVIGYISIEGYSLLNAFYMTVNTIASVGFGEPYPLSDSGKVFTSILILLSVGFIAFAATTLTRYIVSGVFFNYFKVSKVKREIDKLHDHVIVVGYGRNGTQAIDELTNLKIPVIVIENRESKIAEIQQKNSLLYIHDDPSRDDVLLEAGVKRAKALISVLPTDEENLFVVLTTRELNQEITIISRAINFNTIKKLKTAGASHVIMPDKISGQQMAKMIAQPDTVEFLDYIMLERSNNFTLSEIYGKSLAIDANNIRDILVNSGGNFNILGLKRPDGSYLVNPDLNVVFEPNDLLFILGRPEEIKRLLK